MSPGRRSLQEALDRIETVRQQREGTYFLREDHITLSHGSGGKATRNLVEGLFAPAFSNPVLEQMGDAAVLPLDGTGRSLAFTTDSYVVSPIFFPGGNIGELAVNGTVNDLAVAGARPLWISAGLILEEGFPIEDLRRVVAGMRAAADRAEIRVVAGDTKVVEKGKGDGIYVNTTGVGLLRAGAALSSDRIRPGDRLLVSGRIADHGVAILMEREELAMQSEIESDTAPLNGLVAELLDDLGEDVHFLRDATRGGIAAVLNEIAAQAGVGVEIAEDGFPIRQDVRGACEILGLDPFHIANEGKLVAVVAEESAERALEAMRFHPLGQQAALVGEVTESHPGMVVVRTGLGGRRVLDMLVGDALPRIC